MLKSLVLLGIFSSVVIAPLSAVASQAVCHVAGAVLPESIPASLIRRPIRLRHGIALVHESVTTSSQNAQRYYDQGLTFLYAYDWIEAARFFTQALDRDPKLAMAHLGLSYAFSGLGVDASARNEAEQATRLVQYAGNTEATRIELRMRQLQSMSAELEGRNDTGYRAALARALAQNPHDIQLLLLSGNAAEGTAFGRGQRGGMESITYYEQVLKLDPANPAAHHFLIHAWEMVGNIEEAIKHARIFAASSPSLPH